jgi:hypothetical protein
MPSIQRAQDIEPGQCPGAAEYGRGLSRTVVHGGGCCDRWQAEHRDELLELALNMAPIPQRAGHVYTGICPVDGMAH